MKAALYLQVFKEEDWPFVRLFMDRWSREGGQLLVNDACYADLTDHWGESTGVYSSFRDLDPGVDLMVSFGGDGTMLRAATYLKNADIPLVGVNTGRLGFLSTVHKEAVDYLVRQFMDGNYRIEHRRLLSIECRESPGIFTDMNFALNEFALSRKDTTSMITIDTHLNDEFLTSYWADGLIISSPTGSTGYSLSCGGPVISPGVRAWVLTPIAPHNLNARPLVVPDDTRIRVRVSGREDHHLVSLDSRIYTVPNDWEFTIQKADFMLKMLLLPEENFLTTLRNKLLWGEDQRN